MIPWWGKIIGKIFLSRIPVNYSTWKNLGLFRHGPEDFVDYSIKVFVERAHSAGVLKNLGGKKILELGPGDSISSAIIAASMGASATLIDVGQFADKSLSFYRRLTSELTVNGYYPINLEHCGCLDDVLRHCRGRYLTNGLDGLRSLPDHSVDYIFSQAVLEHIRRDEFLETLRQCRRVLSPGGLCSHQIDLRDHLGGKLNNRRFSSKIWEGNFFSSSGFYTNRISYSEMIALFSAAGFKVQTLEIKKWASLPTPRRLMASEFSGLSDDDLLISQFDVVLG